MDFIDVDYFIMTTPAVLETDKSNWAQVAAFGGFHSEILNANIVIKEDADPLTDNWPQCTGSPPTLTVVNPNLQFDYVFGIDSRRTLDLSDVITDKLC